MRGKTLSEVFADAAEPRRGRPPLPPSERRSERIEIRLTREEYAAIKSAADRAAVDVAAWVRDGLLRRARK